MEIIVSRCGNICSDCPWSKYYRKKVEKDDWEYLSEQYKKYVGYTPIKYEWEGCVGCRTPNEQLPKHPHHNFLKACNTRKCVNFNEIETCAHCTRFPCANTVTVQGLTREKQSKKLGVEISDSDYMQFIQMFDSMKNMTEIRNALHEKQLKNPKPVEKPLLGLNISEKINNKELKRFYAVLRNIYTSNLEIKDTDTKAGFEKWKNRQEGILRLLWIVGTLGKIDERGIKVDGITLNKNKKSAKLPTNEKGWKTYLDTLTNFGIISNLDIKTDQLYTPGGWMRDRIPRSNDPAYYLKMSLDSELKEISFFDKLKEYTTELQTISGKRAYTKFKQLDSNHFI